MTATCFQATTCRPRVVVPRVYLMTAAPLVPPAVAPTRDCEIEKCCDDVNGDGSVIRTFFKTLCFDATGAIVSTATVDGAGAPYTPVSETPCAAASRDLETVESCYQSASDPTNRFTRIDFYDASAATPSLSATVWRSVATGSIVPAPAGVVPCETYESDPIVGCSGGSAVTQWVQKSSAGTPTGAVWYTDSAGATIPTPLAWAPGPCAGSARTYTPRTSGPIDGTAFAVTTTPGSVLRSWSVTVASGAATITNGPDAGTVFPPGSWSYSAPADDPVGALAFLPAFTATGRYMVTWTEG